MRRELAGHSRNLGAKVTWASARVEVQEYFLGDRHLEQYVDLFTRLLF